LRSSKKDKLQHHRETTIIVLKCRERAGWGIHRRGRYRNGIFRSRG